MLRRLIALVFIQAFSVHANEDCSILVGSQALDHIQQQIETLSNTVSKIDEKEEISCSKELVNNILKAIQNEISSSSQSLSMSFYHNLDKVMYCDSKGEIKEIKQKLIEQLEVLKKTKKTPFVWADAKGVKIWEEELPEIRQNLNFKLSQLNSAVIVFVPSEKNNETIYNFEADLSLPIFSSWDRRKDLINYEEGEREKEDRILKKPASNFIRNYNHIEVSKIGILDKSCLYYAEKEKVKCNDDFSASITHEITHLLETRFPHFFKLLLKAEGGYKDRLKKAQEIVPQFGITKCTLDAYEDFCSDGPISEEDASKIAKATKIIQDVGSSAKRFYTQSLSSSQENFCKTPLLKQDNQNYCVDKKDSLYAFVRNGEEYLQVLVDKAFNDKEQFESSASLEEKHLITLLKEYLY